jgi:hypothetical protein
MLYEKISTLPVKNWIPLQDKFYRLTKMGTMQFSDTGFNDMPNMSYFEYAQAKNGGPIGKSFICFILSFSFDRQIVCRYSETTVPEEPCLSFRWKRNVFQDN